MEQCALEERTCSKERMVQGIEIGGKGYSKKRGEESRGGWRQGEGEGNRHDQYGWEGSGETD